MNCKAIIEIIIKKNDTSCETSSAESKNNNNNNKKQMGDIALIKKYKLLRDKGSI